MHNTQARVRFFSGRKPQMTVRDVILSQQQQGSGDGDGDSALMGGTGGGETVPLTAEEEATLEELEERIAACKVRA
jgi:hypothetical protein